MPEKIDLAAMVKRSLAPPQTAQPSTAFLDAADLAADQLDLVARELAGAPTCADIAGECARKSKTLRAAIAKARQA